MAIDDPLGQALAQVEAEKRAANPVIERLSSAGPFLRFGAAALAAIRAGDLSGVVRTLKDFADLFSRDRSEYLLGVVISELRELLEKFEHLGRSHQDYLNREWPALFLDADNKARQTRGRDKIERIAKIVSSAAYRSGPPDETEEFMRVAMSLDDRDVQVLSIIVKIQGSLLQLSTGRVRTYGAYSHWSAVCAETRTAGIVQGELDAICGKLESFGLVTRGERHSNIVGDQPTPFALLFRGKAFLEIVHSRASSWSV